MVSGTQLRVSRLVTILPTAPDHHGKGKDPAKRAAHMLDKFDADKDGALTPAEVAQHPHFAGRFAEIDADKDGKLTPGELQEMKGRGEERGHGRHDMDPAERAAKALERFDADKDGALSVAEVADHPRLSGHFAEIDGDRDGNLSAAELTAFKPPAESGAATARTAARPRPRSWARRQAGPRLSGAPARRPFAPRRRAYGVQAGNCPLPGLSPASMNGTASSSSTLPWTSVTRKLYGPGPMPDASTKKL